ncbi:hypothetical protein KRX54_03540 [Actinomycetaceae bacterium TAE3-ERU4]|nr:hypothetical protein [Actinomycetaceae bacterium TAE3-ERU4]
MNDIYFIIKIPVAISNQHPLPYNLLLGGLVRGLDLLTGSYVPGVVIFAILQMLLWAMILAGIAAHLGLRGISLHKRWILVFFCAFTPLVANYSFALVKDSLSTIFTILLSYLIYLLCNDSRSLLLNRFFRVALLVSLVGFALFRNNATVVFFALLPLLIFWGRKYLRQIIAICAISSILVILPLRLSAHLAGKHKFVESVGIPLQLIAHSLKESPECVSESSKRLYSSAIPIESWKKLYDAKTVDRIKYGPGFKPEAINSRSKQFLESFITDAPSCATSYLQGYLLHTQPAWDFDLRPHKEQTQSYFNRPFSNLKPTDWKKIRQFYQSKGITYSPLLPTSFAKTIDTLTVSFSQIFGKIGIWFWAWILLIVGAVYSRRWPILAFSLPGLLMWVTLMLTSPTMIPFRYFAFAPVLVALGLILLNDRRAA